MSDIIVDKKFTQDETNNMMSSLELDLIALYKVMLEDYLMKLETYEGTPESFIAELGDTLEEPMTANDYVAKAKKPIGSISDRKDGKYKTIKGGSL